LVDGVGSIEELYYEELVLYTFRSSPRVAARTERVPVLREVLQLVRDHAGLLHLDIKKPGIDAELLADNDNNSDAFKRAAVPKLRFKGSLMGHGSDAQPSAAEKLLQGPGKMVIVDDPRALLAVMGKSPVRILPKPMVPLSTRPPPSLESLKAVIRGNSRQLPVRVAALATCRSQRG
jgi:hypothetical protein